MPAAKICVSFFHFSFIDLDLKDNILAPEPVASVFMFDKGPAGFGGREADVPGANVILCGTVSPYTH